MTSQSTDTVCGLATSAGHRRARNEDAALAGPTWYVLADGMGGHDDGHVASQIVIDTFASTTPDPTGAEVAIATALAAANDIVRRHAREHGSRSMGSTVVGLVLSQGPPTVFHVGDSRCYRLVDGEMRLLTRDHTHVQELIDANQLTTDQASRHPLRNVVTRAVGIDPTLTADVVELDHRPSRYLLCSDGLTHEVGPRASRRVLSGIEDPQAAAERLVELALEGPATDNITALVVDVGPTRENEPVRSRPTETESRP